MVDYSCFRISLIFLFCFFLITVSCSKDSITNDEEENEQVEEIKSSFYIDTQGEVEFFKDLENYEVEFPQLINEFGYSFFSSTNEEAFSGTDLFYRISPTPEQDNLTDLFLNIYLPKKLLTPGEFDIYDYRNIEAENYNTETPISSELNTMRLIINYTSPSWSRVYLSEDGLLTVYTDPEGRLAGKFSAKFGKVSDNMDNEFQESDTLNVSGKFYLN